RLQEDKAASYWISEQVSAPAILKNHRIPKPVLIRIGEEQLPVRTSIGGFVNSRLIAGPGGHYEGCVCVPGPDAAKVELFRFGRHGTALPHVAAVFGAQDRTARTTGPRHSAANSVDAA